MDWTAPPYALFEPPFIGGFARVYKATRADRPGRFFAVKFQRDPASAEHLKRLRREAEILGAIEHPNILKLVEAQLAAKPPFVVFEYMTGGSLADYLVQQRLDYEGAALLLRQLSSALAVFHTKGGFHRDIKPDNVLIGPDGAFVLADANLAGMPMTSSSFTQNVAGTPGYIDPYVVNHPYDSAADIWSLAVTMLEAIAGDRPSVESLEAGVVHLGSMPAPTEAHRIALERLLSAMLSRSRSKRPGAMLVHTYADVLLRGGQLPPLAEPPRPPQSDIGSAIAGIGILALIFVGVAALMDPGPPAKPKPQRKDAKPGG